MQWENIAFLISKGFKWKPVQKCKKELEAPGIDPGTSRMLSERSTIWATPPTSYELSNGWIYLIVEL